MKRETFERTKRRFQNGSPEEYRAKCERMVKAMRKREKNRRFEGDYEDRFYR